MKLSNQKIPAIIALTISSAMVTACGGSNDPKFVKGAKVQTYNQDGQGYVELQATLDSGQAQFPAFELPIIDPNYPDVIYGKISIRDTLIPGESALGISVNVSAVANYPLADPYLPNGTPLPISGLEATNVIAVPLDYGIRVYAALASNVVVLGAAIPIAEFDKVGAAACPVNFMPGFNLGGGIRGIAGVFAGCNPGESGVGIFIDGSGALFPPAEGAGDNQPVTIAALRNLPDADNAFVSLNPLYPETKKEDQKVKKAIYQINQKYKKKRLHLN